MSPRTCAGCGEPLSPLARANARHHNSACRTRAYAKRRRAAERAAERSTPLARVFGLTEEQQKILDNAVSEPRLVALVARAAQAPGGWRAAAWILERRHPSRWGTPQHREVVRDVRDVDDADPFAEVDMLAERRRARLERRPEGY